MTTLKGSQNFSNSHSNNNLSNSIDSVFGNKNDSSANIKKYDNSIGTYNTNTELDFDYLTISLASPEKILLWSYGEVKSSDTINYRTFKPEKDSLFCAKIFGPIKDYECACGKYKRRKYKGIKCEKCEVEVTSSRVRRERMGHINLVYPVVNILYLKSVPSKMSILLDIPAKSIEQVVYFEKFIVIDPGNTYLEKYQVLSESEYENAMNEFGQSAFTVGNGAEGIKNVLSSMDLKVELVKIQNLIQKTKSELKLKNMVRRMTLIEDLIASGNKVEWMVLTVLPVIPPELRPLVPLDGGKMAISDLNLLYARVINRNNRLKRLMEMNAPELILRNERRMLQDSVNTLFNNSIISARTAKNSIGKPLKSISDFLKGKNGRFRQNLLGKRVDYSGRSVIVVGPELKLHECGIPKKMALELFKPFILSKLRLYGKASTIRAANNMIDSELPEVWEILENIIIEHPVLLNRAPTLHRLGIQAFEPKLIESKAIQLHPLVCRAFNADFDGDQMAVHIPLSIEAQIEARVLMLSSNNIINSANGTAVIIPRKDITAGLYYMTSIFDNEPGKSKKFYDYDHVLFALENKMITVNTSIEYYFKYRNSENEKLAKQLQSIDTTAGRLMLYNLLPNDGKINFEEFNLPWSVSNLGEIVHKIYDTYGNKITVIFCDKIMNIGFKYATLSGLSIGKDDIVVPATKPQHIANTMLKIQETERQYTSGYITQKEKFNKVTDYWSDCTNIMSKDMMLELKKNNNNRNINSISIMMNSGARASEAQMKQLATMRGLIAKPSGGIVETPVISNFKEGLTVLEYFNSAHGARKGNVDTALKTADAGYLTRRLVDVAQDCIITEHDCGTHDGIIYKVEVEDGKIVKKLSSFVVGRFVAEDVIDENDNIVLKSDELIDRKKAKLLDDHNIITIKVRSVVTCKTKFGVCGKCYGINLATNHLINIGEAIGVVAAQSIGEPGTQLTLSTFHVGGATSKKSVQSHIDAEFSGKIKFNNVRTVCDKDGKNIVVSYSSEILIIDKYNKILSNYKIEYGSNVYVSDGDDIKIGTKIADWDPYNAYIITEHNGKIKFEDMIRNVSYTESIDEVVNRSSKAIINWSDISKTLKPAICMIDMDGKAIVDANKIEARYFLSFNMVLTLSENDVVRIGDKIARVPRESFGIVKDITGGLPRVEEVFEARVPKEPAIIAGADGYIEFSREVRLKNKIILHPNDKTIEPIVYAISKDKYIAVRDGAEIRKGDIIIQGDLNPHDILKFQGVAALTIYVVNEIQKVYRLQGVEIDSKHIEVIVKYMLQKVVVSDSGNTKLKNGYQYDVGHVLEQNDIAENNKLIPAKYRHVLYGITKASMQTESFISAASFQETLKVLTDAAIKNKRDNLRGMKESIIIGRLIPAGTGYVVRKLREKARQIIKDEMSIDNPVINTTNNKAVEIDIDF